MKNDLYEKLNKANDATDTLDQLYAQHQAAHPGLSDREARLAVIATPEGKAAYAREQCGAAPGEHVNPFLGVPRAALQAEFDKLVAECGGRIAAVRTPQGRDLYNALSVAR